MHFDHTHDSFFVSFRKLSRNARIRETRKEDTVELTAKTRREDLPRRMIKGVDWSRQLGLGAGVF